MIAMLFRRLAVDCNGNVAVIFGLATIPIFAAVGAAIDYSAANSSRTEMQAAADESALAVAKEAYRLSANQMSQKGSDYFYANFHRSTTKVGQVTSTYDPSKSTVTVAANGSVKTAFMQLLILAKWR
ncbi:MAG TPA: TadE/TadG family type IV pilus assembly protein [Gammaproteobacteria bacterium]|nr:TadE/TadG family type IV pilus assembly protein [Gammaproteobacteria bacterium]